MELLGSFGIEGKLLLWQLINFGVLFAVLWYILYKPLRRIISEREGKVRESLAAAASLEEKSRALETEFNQKIDAQRKEFQELHARTLAEEEQMRKSMRAQAESEARAIVEEARRTIKQEQTQLLSSLEGEIKKLALSLASKVLEKELDPGTEKRLLDDALSALKNEKRY
jgi:F-type H+-transporting ATPase subunit b